MPTYDYRCDVCGERQEHRLSFSDYVDRQPCACGAEAVRTFETCPEILVRGNQKAFKLDALDMPIGWENGNVDPVAQERRYSEIIETEKKAARANDKQAIKQGLRKIATIPRELHRARSRQFGKSYFDPTSQSPKEFKQKLKDDGLLFHNS